MSFYEKHAKEKFFSRPIQPLIQKTFILLWSNLSSLSIMEAIQQNQNVCSRRHFPGAVFSAPIIII